jgi:hypothetical protein
MWWIGEVARDNGGNRVATELERLQDENATLRELVQWQESILRNISRLCNKWGADPKNHVPRSEVIELLTDWRTRTKA